MIFFLRNISFTQEQLSTFSPDAIPKADTVEEIVNKIGTFIKEATESKDMGTRLFGFDAEKAISLVHVLEIASEIKGGDSAP